ncbi:hypothetical protein ES702_06829 [subsurface metagenome]
MRIFHLKRIAFITSGTFGVLLDGETPFCLTLERLWLNNRKNESCISIGNYWCKRVDSPKFGNTFEVMDVPGRTLIRFHKGKLVEDTHGCIIPGEEFGIIDGQVAILSSGRAFAEFLMRLSDVDEFYLEITHGN